MYIQRKNAFSVDSYMLSQLSNLPQNYQENGCSLVPTDFVNAFEYRQLKDRYHTYPVHALYINDFRIRNKLKQELVYRKIEVTIWDECMVFRLDEKQVDGLLSSLFERLVA